MSQSTTCLRNRRAVPLQNIIATSGESFICVGYNHRSDRSVPQDRFCHCWKNSEVDEHGHWDRRDITDTLSVMATALSIDANIMASEKLTEAQMNKADLTAQQPEEDLPPDAAVAAIAFALDYKTEDSMEFLRLWNQGDFEECRKWWPDAPAEVYVGADPLFDPAAVKETAL